MSVQITEQYFYDMRNQRDVERTKNLELQIEIARLTAGSEAMQEDAANNTITVKMLMAQLAEVNEENRGLRQMLHMEAK